MLVRLVRVDAHRAGVRLTGDVLRQGFCHDGEQLGRVADEQVADHNFAQLAQPGEFGDLQAIHLEIDQIVQALLVVTNLVGQLAVLPRRLGNHFRSAAGQDFEKRIFSRLRVHGVAAAIEKEHALVMMLGQSQFSRTGLQSGTR